MRSLLLFLCLAGLAAAASAGEPPCRVIDPELQGSYEGGCRNGLAQGYGVAQGEAEYRGEFRAGLKEGQGVKTWAWGDRYEGGFLNDRRHGRGMYTWGSGSPWAGERYEGDYVADQREGQGTYWWPSGDRFEGTWKADQRYGYSAMEIRRQAAEKARAEALTPGTRVCATGKVGLAHQVLRVGRLETVEQARVTVRLERLEGDPDIVAAATPGPGELVSGTASEWGVCQ
jgi:hypothetical protein